MSAEVNINPSSDLITPAIKENNNKIKKNFDLIKEMFKESLQQGEQLSALGERVICLSEDIHSMQMRNEELRATLKKESSKNTNTKDEICKKSAGIAVTTFVLSGLVFSVLQQLHEKGLI